MRIRHSPEDIRIRDGIPQADHRPCAYVKSDKVQGTVLLHNMGDST
jgi:hypothetical protein